MNRLVFALLLLASAAASAATIGGTVTNDRGAPLAGITVAAYTAAGALQTSATANTSGVYSLTLPGGTYRVLAYDPSGVYATSFYADADSFDTSTPVTVTSSATNINLRLAMAGFVDGGVTSPGGSGLFKMTVAAYNLSGTRRGFTTTDVNGAFKLALPPGTYKVAAYDETLGYATTFFDGATSFAAAAPVAVVATQSTTIGVQLPLAAALTGTVYDRATAAELGGMRVTAYAADGTVAGQTLGSAFGHYAMAVRPGAMRIVVDDPAGNYATTFVPDAESFSTAQPMTVHGGDTLNSVITLQRGGRIAGRVTDRTTGAALAGITAAAYNADGTTRAAAASDAAGNYSIVVPPGDFRVGAFDPALVYLPQFYLAQSLFANASVAHALAQQTASGFDFAMAKGARVAGRITARSTSTPLSAIAVGAYDAAGRLLASAATDAAGNYALLLAPATVKLLAFDPALRYANGYYLGAPTFASTQSLALAEGTSLAADFAMADAGRIAGSVADAATGTPLAAMQVLVYDASFQTVAEAMTDAAGTFRIAVPAGAYTIAAADPSHRYRGAAYGSPIVVAAGQDIGPFPIRLAVAAVVVRHRAVAH
jgi:Carboxypeptidase regulatory-like domain